MLAGAGPLIHRHRVLAFHHEAVEVLRHRPGALPHESFLEEEMEGRDHHEHESKDDEATPGE